MKLKSIAQLIKIYKCNDVGCEKHLSTNPIEGELTTNIIFQNTDKFQGTQHLQARQALYYDEYD